MLDQLFQFLLPYEALSYLMVFGILMLCGLGLPIPEDITLVVSGILVSKHVMKFDQALLVCMLGILGGDSLVHLLGRQWGARLLQTRYVAKLFPPSTQAKVHKAFFQYGGKVIFIARFMPGLRAPIYFYSGLVKKPVGKFVLVDFLAAIISVPAWIYVGVVFGDNLPALERAVKNIEMGIYLVLAVVILVFFFGTRLKRIFTKSLE